MNKPIFFSGLGLIGAELISVVIYLLSTISYAWMTWDLVVKVIIFSMLGIMNITAVIFMIVGAVKK